MVEVSVGKKPDAAEGIAPPFVSQSGREGDDLVETSVGMRPDAAEGIAPPLVSQSGSEGDEMERDPQTVPRVYWSGIGLASHLTVKNYRSKVGVDG